MLCYMLTWGVHELIPSGGPEGTHVADLSIYATLYLLVHV